MPSLAYIANIRLPTEKAHGIQIMKTAEALVHMGVSVKLIVPCRRNSIVEDVFEFYNLSSRFTITKLPCFDLVTNNFFGRFGYALQSWTFFRSVKKYLQKKSFAVLYTRDTLLAYWLSKKYSNVFFEIHTLPDQPQFFHKQAWQKSRGLIVISSGIQKKLIEYGVPKEKIVVAHDAMDPRQFRISESKDLCRQKLGIPLGIKVAVYTGHLYEWKGADILAGAAERLLKDGVDVYLIGGTQEEVHRLRKTFRFPNLHIIGWQKHSLIPVWLHAADVLVLPNSAATRIGSTYTSPLKLFEYMAAGKPIVASKVLALEDILSHVKYGAVWFQPDDVDSLANALRYTFDHREEVTPMKEVIFEKLKEFTWESRAEKITAFIFSHERNTL